jgi:hypothetical protein
MGNYSVDLLKTLPLVLDTIEVGLNDQKLKYIVWQCENNNGLYGSDVFTYSLTDGKGFNVLELEYNPEYYKLGSSTDSDRKLEWRITMVADERILGPLMPDLNGVKIINSPLRNIIRTVAKCKGCGLKNCFTCPRPGTSKDRRLDYVSVLLPGKFYYDLQIAPSFRAIAFEGILGDLRFMCKCPYDPATFLPTVSDLDLLRGSVVYCDNTTETGTLGTPLGYMQACEILKRNKQLNHYFI